jgi:hypothetical protein
MAQDCYLFTREQLLQALEDHAATFTDPQQADRMRIFVLAFLDGEKAKANGLHFTPSPVGVEAKR